MESLGLSDSSSTWSDRPLDVAIQNPVSSGRHLAPPPEPDPITGWQTAEFGSRLTGSNLRWGLIGFLLVLTVIAGAVTFWLLQRPALQAQANRVELSAASDALNGLIPDLEAAETAFLDTPDAIETATLNSVNAAARQLFTASGGLPESETTLRAAATSASGAALDAVRLLNESHAYRMAVGPMLTLPDLETDPKLIELDEAARTFGGWQLTFDNMVKALPDGVLPEVTEQLDILSADLSTVMDDYVEALRSDDAAATGAVLSALAERLTAIGSTLDTALANTQVEVGVRIDEVRAALAELS